MSRELSVALPFWLDRPDEEAVEIGLLAEAAGIETVWVGELASFDAFSLATAIGVQTERVRLKVGAARGLSPQSGFDRARCRVRGDVDRTTCGCGPGCVKPSDRERLA